MARFTWMDTYVFVEFDNGDSEEFQVGNVVTRNVPDYSKTNYRWMGVITSIWGAGKQIMLVEFRRFGTSSNNVEVINRPIGEDAIVESNLAIVSNPLTVASEFASAQAAVTRDTYRARQTLEEMENTLDLVSSVLAPIRFSASEEHRAQHIEPAQSAEAIIREMVGQGMLPLAEQAADARRQMNLENGEEVTK